MEFEFYCPCGKLLTAEREWIGKRAQCPTCRAVLQVPKPNRVADIAPPKRPKVKDQPRVQEPSATAKAERPAESETPQAAKAQTEQEEQISQPSGADENAEKQVAASESVESQPNAAQSQEKPVAAEKKSTELREEPVVEQAAQLHVDGEEITEDIEEPAKAISEHKGGWECEDAEAKDATESIAPLAKQIAALTDMVAALQSTTEQRPNDSGISNKGFAIAAIVLLVAGAFFVGRMSQTPPAAQGSQTGLDSEDNAITALQTVTAETDVTEHTHLQERPEAGPAAETVATADSQVIMPPQAAESVGGPAMSEVNTDAQFLIDNNITEGLGSPVVPEAPARPVGKQNVGITEAPIARIEAARAARAAERVNGDVFEVTYNSNGERLGKAKQLEPATPVVKVTGIGVAEIINNVAEQTRVALATAEKKTEAPAGWVPVDPEVVAKIKNQWSGTTALERLINCYERNAYLADTGEEINLFLDPVRQSVPVTTEADISGAKLLRSVADNGAYLLNLLLACQNFSVDNVIGSKPTGEMLHMVVFPRRDIQGPGRDRGAVSFTPGPLRDLTEVAEHLGTPTAREWWAGSNMQELGMSGVVFWWGQVGVSADDDGQITHVLLRGPRG